MSLNFRKPCIVGNWKMQGSEDMIQQFLPELLYQEPKLREVDIVLCPPALYLQQARYYLNQTQTIHSTVKLGAQNVYCESKGAFTGEISPDMLVDVGCEYVIIGHSERRQLFAEEDTLIARKFMAAYHTGLIPILCVGETRMEREQGKTFEVITRQLTSVFGKSALLDCQNAVIAYEPVWAIGTGLSATPLEAETVHLYIRDWLRAQDKDVAERIRLLYGGSVKAENAKSLLMQPNIDGVLVGGASIVAHEFVGICQSGKERFSWNKLS